MIPKENENNNIFMLDDETFAKMLLPNGSSYLITFFDGTFYPELSNIHSAPLTFTLNDRDGFILHIPANTVLEKIVHILFISSTDIAQDLYNNIIAEENSKATIIEEFVYLQNNAYTNTIYSDLILKKNSSITHYKLQKESKQATHKHEWLISQKANSQFFLNYFGDGSHAAQDTLQIKLEEKASCNIRGIYFAQDEQTAELHAHIEHLAPQTNSEILFKEILHDNSTGAFTGRVLIEKTAPNSETHVTNKNLLLSDGATIKTAPELVIFTDDVKCTHGATVGQLDQNSLFYLRSRGIAEEDAKQLLIQGFVQEIFDGFIEPVKRKITW
jgi:FeS assembly protein SufD